MISSFLEYGYTTCDTFNATIESYMWGYISYLIDEDGVTQSTSQLGCIRKEMRMIVYRGPSDE